MIEVTLETRDFALEAALVALIGFLLFFAFEDGLLLRVSISLRAALSLSREACALPTLHQIDPKVAITAMTVMISIRFSIGEITRRLSADLGSLNTGQISQATVEVLPLVVGCVKHS